MRARRRLLAAAAILAALPLTSPPFTPAQTGRGGLATDVRLSEVTAAPGEVLADRVKAINLSGRSLRVGVLIRDVGADADGNPISVPRDTGARSAAAWVRISPSTFELAAGATRDMAIQVAVPAAVKPGGYYASILFDAAGVQASTVAEHVILVRVPGAGAAPDARIVRFRMPAFTVGGPVDLRLELANAGNVHAVVAGTINIEDQFGNRVGRLTVQNALILPGHQRLLSIRWLNPPPLARIRAVAALNLAGKSGTRAATGFTLAWWVIGAAALAFALPLYGLRTRRRRRRRKARAAAEAAARPKAPVGPLAPAPEGAWPGAPPKPEKPGRLRRRGRAQEPGPVVPPVGPPSVPQQPAAPSRSVPLGVSTPTPVAPEKPDAARFAKPEDEPEKPAPSPYDELREDTKREDARVVPERPAGKVLPPTAPKVEAPPKRGPVVVPAAPPPSGEEPLVVHGKPTRPAEPEPAEPKAAERERVAPETAEPETAEPGAAEGEPSWAPVEESEEFADWLDAVRSEPEPEEPFFAPPQAERPVAIARPSAPERPVPVVPGPEPVVPGARAEPGRPVVIGPIQERPVSPGHEAEEIQTAWPDQPETSVPAWQDEGGESLTGAAALRRAKVALDMLAGPTGETGAILDAALELLRSVRSDPAVVEIVRAAFARNRGRRKLGAIALALGVVEAAEAPGALLDAYATAPKVVADRLQAALAACDPADLRRSVALLDALPPARRYSLGL